MLSESDAARRRELQRRAFAPGDPLTAAEQGELRDLDQRHRAASAPAQVPITGAAQGVPGHAERDRPVGPEAPIVTRVPGSEATSPATEDQVSVEAAGASAVAPGALAGASGASGASDVTGRTDTRARRPSSRSRRRLISALALLAAVVVGAAGGLLLSMRMTEPAVVMTDEQQRQFTEIAASGDYDPGSVRFAGGKHGASVWSATREDGTRQCIVLRYGKEHSSACEQPSDEDGDQGVIGVSIDVQTDDGAATITGLLVTTVSGDSAAVVQRHERVEMSGWQGQYTDEELALIEALQDEGLEGSSLQIMGYDLDTPVWAAIRSSETCLAVVDPDAYEVSKNCVPMPMEGIELALPDVTYSLTWSERRGPQLTVIRHAPSITCDVDSGYCASIDDTTGDLR